MIQFLFGKRKTDVVSTWQVSVVLVLFCHFISCKQVSGETASEIPQEEYQSDTVKIMGGGKLLSVEDAGYPFATVVIEKEKGKDTLYFRLNFSEIISINPGKLGSMTGKKVNFEGIMFHEKSILDIQQEGVSLLGGLATEDMADLLSSTGILSGARAATEGDLPTVIRIHDPEGDSFQFQCYVTPEMTKAEGGIVTGYYRNDLIYSLQKISVAD